MQALNEYMVDRAVLPVENSIAGSLHSVYDLILRYKMHIVGEVTLKVLAIRLDGARVMLPPGPSLPAEPNAVHVSIARRSPITWRSFRGLRRRTCRGSRAIRRLSFSATPSSGKSINLHCTCRLLSECFQSTDVRAAASANRSLGIAFEAKGDE